MKITLQQLTGPHHKLAPIYFINGDEALLVQEACTALRGHAMKANFTDREIFHVEAGFNWESFTAAATTLSLFSENTLLEVHLHTKVTKVGEKSLLDYANNPPPNKILLLISEKIDAATQKTAWYKLIEKNGAILPIWPIDTQQLPQWIATHLSQFGLKADANGIKLLADYAAGNLLAAHQEIEKLSLIYGKKALTIAEIAAVISDNAKYNVFNLGDVLWQNEPTKLLKVIQNLKSEGVEPTLILWAITRELRTLINTTNLIATGTTLDKALQVQNIWSNRKLIIKQALQKYNLTALQNLLQKMTHLDLIIKGAESGNFWQELERVLILR